MSLGKISVAIEAQMASFESDMGRAARIAEKEFKKIERDAKRTEAQMKQAGKVIGLALVAGAAAATVAIKGAINAMDDLSKAAQRANMPTEDFSRLAYAGKLADVSMEDLQGSLGKLAKAQADSLKSTSAQAKVFQALGISAKNTDGSLRATKDVMADFADRFKEMRGSPEIMAAGMQLFGKSFQSLIPLLKDGSQGLRDAADESDRFGYTLSEKAGKDAEAFNDELSRIGVIGSGVARQIAGELLPQLREGAERFRRLADNGDLARNAVTLLSAGLSAGVGILEGYTNAVNRTSIALGTMAGMRAGLEESIKNAATFGMADGTLMGGMRSAMAGMAEGQKELDALIARQNKAGSPQVLMSGRDAMPESMFKRPQQLTPAQEAEQIKAARARAEAIRKALGDPDPKAKSGAGKKSGTSALETAARDAQKARDELARLVEQTERARSEFDAMAASLAGPLSEAAYRFSVEQERLNELARTGEVEASRLQAAQGQLRAEYEKNVEAIKAQLTPAQEVHAAIQEEIKLLGMSAQAQEIYNNLKAAGVEANSAFGESIIASTRELQAMREQAAFMADVQFGLADAFVEMASGAKSAKEAFGDFADDLFKTALRFVADTAIKAFFDALKPGGAGRTEAGGFDWGGALGAVLGAFGGGRANGGPVSGGKFYEVGENNRPEILRSRGKQYLIPGNEGNVVPIRSGGGSRHISQVFNVQGAPDRRTRGQMARESGRAAARELGRTGR